MNFATMKMSTRLYGSFLLILAFLVASTGYGLNRMAEINRRMAEITDVNNVQAQQLTVMQLTLEDRMIAIANLALRTDPVAMQPELDRIQKQEKIYRTAENTLNQMFATQPTTAPKERAGMEKIKAMETAALPLMARAAQLGFANQADEATHTLVNELRPAHAAWFAALAEMIAIEAQLNSAAASDAKAAYAHAQRAMLAIGALALLVGLAIAFLITRQLTRQLGGEPHEVVGIAERIAAGDLAQAVHTAPHDQSSVVFAMQTMRDNLVRIVSGVRSNAEGVATASEQIAHGNNDLRSRTEEQASALQANQLSLGASKVAAQGGAVVAEVVHTMQGINDASNKIADIIGVIDSIAFQTNILALNAAVEAARAGEQGRGFAVVATEVRSLARRSADAAKEIKLLILASVERVEQGTALVDKAGATMTEVVQSIRRVTDIMGEISAASSEQSLGVRQIGEAITQMDRATQQNAALVEQSAAADSLKAQADQLVQEVAVFQLPGGRLQAAAPARRIATAAAPTRPKALPPTPHGTAAPHRPRRGRVGKLLGHRAAHTLYF